MINDEYGNRIYRENNNIYLDLVSQPIRKKLGRIVEKDKRLITYRSYEKHTMRMNKSWGFNYKLLETAKKFDTVEIHTDTRAVYNVPVSFIRDKGEILFFKQQGFEKQIFVKLDYLREFMEKL